MIAVRSTAGIGFESGNRIADAMRRLDRQHAGPGAGYDAVKANDNKRRAIVVSTKSEDEELKPEDRRRLISLTRDSRRNMSIAAWAIRKHLDYVSSFRFQAATPDKQFNQALQDRIKWRSKARNCDVARRHYLGRFLRIIEAHATCEGDSGILRVEGGRLQGIEPDRIQSFSDTKDRTNVTQGVRTDPAGAATAYVIGKRKPNGAGFEFEREVSADNFWLHGYFDRFDQVRGVSPLTSGINTLRDVYEANELALAKMKVVQMFGLAIYRQATGADAGDDIGTVSAEEDEDGEETSRYKVDFGKGPFKLELEDSDRAEFLESHSPSSEHREYHNVAVALSLKSLDIPYSFYDEAHTNYSGSRSGLLLYEKSAEEKRNNLRCFLDELTAWWIVIDILNGDLALPLGMAFDMIKWNWLSTGIPWLDPLKEVNADVTSRNAGFDSTVDICQRNGDDAYELADREADYQAYRESIGLSRSLEPPANLQINEVSNAA